MENQTSSDLALSLHLQNVSHWPYLPMLTRIVLAVALGLFVGMERERRGKEAGIRTFAFTSLLGCLCALLGDAYALMGLALLGVLIAFLNWQRLATNQTAELTTSAALLVTGVMGVLCGKGHDFTPVLVGLLAAALLAWKERMTDFSIGLTEAELRSAILLGILAFVVYPVLPEKALDPWNLVEPRSAWVTVLLIAAVGFVNYILLKRYGARGAAVSGFLGGLVNSTVVVTELASRARNVREDDTGSPMLGATYQGTVLATAAMVLRNGILLLMLSPAALWNGAGVPLLLMLVASAALTAISLVGHQVRTAVRSANGEKDGAGRTEQEPSSGPSDEISETANHTSPETAAAPIRLDSPFSLPSALKFGVIFLCLHTAGTLAQRWLGAWGFYAVSVAGGLVSSASAVASAGALAAHGGVSPAVAGTGAVLASLASALINLPIVARVARQPHVTKRVVQAVAGIVFAGLVGVMAQEVLRIIR